MGKCIYIKILITCRFYGIILCIGFVSRHTFSNSVSTQQQLSSWLDVLTHTQTHIHTLTRLTPTGTLHSHVLLGATSYLTGKPEGGKNTKYYILNVNVLNFTTHVFNHYTVCGGFVLQMFNEDDASLENIEI